MTKEEALDIIVQNYKNNTEQNKIKSDYCQKINWDCEACPFGPWNTCEDLISKSLIERLISAEEKKETNLEHYASYYNHSDHCIYVDTVKLTNEAHCRLNNFDEAIEWLLEPYKPPKPKYKLSKLEYDLLDFCKQYNDTQTVEDWSVLMDMQNKGHYKGISKEIKLRDILDNAEVINE